MKAKTKERKPTPEEQRIVKDAVETIEAFALDAVLDDVIRRLRREQAKRRRTGRTP